MAKLPLRVAAATAVTVGLGVLSAPAAVADSTSDYTLTSFKGGRGYGAWINPNSSDRRLQACDQGYADGLRVVAEIWWEGGYTETHAAGGSGTCKTESKSFVSPGAYRFRVCLRDGAVGADEYCSDLWFGTVD